MTKISVVRPGLISPPRQPLPSVQADDSPMASSRIGNARTTSMMRESAVSSQPPKKPASVPMSTPKKTARPVEMNATSSETRAP